ncbi:hypothetical protein DRQ09_05690, partial [candidate division KSB1 bacterium]
DTFVKEKDIERLQLLNEILSKGKLKFEDFFPDVIKKPLQELYLKQENEEIKSVIKSLAEKFSVSLKENGKNEVEE